MKRCSNMCSSCVWINYCRLRSKIWWFTGFCRSHYVSHFAAFFIVARTKISVVKSRIYGYCNGFWWFYDQSPIWKDCIQFVVCSSCFGCCLLQCFCISFKEKPKAATSPAFTNDLSTKQNVTHSIILQQCVKRLRHELTLMTTACFLKRNDPSAGSPTDTLLRLLLPLNDTIWGNSPRLLPIQAPYYSLNHSIGNSDGRCVQRPETYSMPVDDWRLLGIPRSWRIITIVNPQHDAV